MTDSMPDSMTDRARGCTPSQVEPSGSVAYSLFVYRQELRRRNVRAVNLSKWKLNLTQELVSYSVGHITDYDVDELMNLKREIQFSRHLKSRMHQMKRMQQLHAMHINIMMRV